MRAWAAAVLAILLMAAPAAAADAVPPVERDHEAIILPAGTTADWTGVLISRRQLDACNAAMPAGLTVPEAPAPATPLVSWTGAAVVAAAVLAGLAAGLAAGR